MKLPRCKYPEYDNNIHKFRIDLGLTLRDVGLSIGINPSYLARIADGSVGPYYVDGTQKKWAQPLCDLLGKEMSEVWPFDICKIKIDKYAGDFDKYAGYVEDGDFTEDQYANIFVAEQRDEASLIESIYLKQMLNKIPDRCREVLTHIFFDGETFEEVGNRIGVCRERVRQIAAKGLIHLRRRSYSDAYSTISSH